MSEQIICDCGADMTGVGPFGVLDHREKCSSYQKDHPNGFTFYGENKPRPDVPHYNSASIEPIDVINSWSKVWGEDSYLCGNVIKYLRRYKVKGGVEDLKKAQDYLTWLIEKHEE